MTIFQATTQEHMDTIRQLFREYELFLDVDLCFQGFEDELAGLPGRYAPPGGSLLIAMDGQDAAGCVALREIGDGVCEMKRLYVKPRFRGKGIGFLLAQKIIQHAVEGGYKLMRLDTLDKLEQAMFLYESLGFSKTGPYYHNPLDGVVYWELSLKKDVPR
jgi:putative acetyltransferase